MSILKKIVTAIRGGASEAGEAIVDANALRILDQEIRDGETHLENAKRNLTKVMAEEMAAGRKMKEATDQIAKYETYAMKALEKGDEALATDVAQKIADIEAELAQQQGIRETYGAQAEKLKGMVKQAESQLQALKREATIVRTTESVHKATRTITDNFSSTGSKVLSAKDSLERIKKRQQAHEDQLQAGELLRAETEGAGLDAKLKEAGIKSDGSAKAGDVLARLKAKQNG
ncbi:MAG: PspA/IM30 family protein [Alphaproteobacteria bacterium]